MPTLPNASTLLTDTSYGVVASLRAPQIELAQHIAQSFAEGTALAAEAGTGVGKTLAYGSQAVEHLLRTEDDFEYEVETEHRDEDGNPRVVTKVKRHVVVIATYTKALQAQIVEQELPRLAAGLVERMRREGADEEAIGKALDRIRFAKKVGKKNHLCMRRVEQMAARNETVKKQLPVYRNFSDTVPGWVIDDAPEDKPLPEDAGRFGVGYCNTDKCGYYDKCLKRGYLAAKDSVDQARIIVTNHAMVAADIVVRKREGGAVLPDVAEAFILDEAHKFPDVLREALTVTFSSKLWTQAVNSYAQLRFELDQGATSLPQILPGITAVRSTCDAFLRDHSVEANDTAQAYARALAAAIRDVLRSTGSTDALHLRQRAQAASEFTAHGAYIKEMLTYLTSLQLHHSALALLCDEVQMKGRYVLVTEEPDRNAPIGEPPVRVLVPVDITRAWSDYMRDTAATPIYVSATLATGIADSLEESFASFLSEIGSTHAGFPVKAFVTSSPFDFERQAVLYLPPGVDHRMADREAYARELVALARPLLLANEGHAFVLFTSRSSLEAFEAALGESDYPYPILSQVSSDQVKSRGASLFKRTPNATLLGLRTFFEGVDVPGLGLSLVIIPQLPVPAPSPVIAAKRAKYDDTFKAFNNVEVPTMTTDLRQMAGRLIRSVNDRGVVAVLDARIASKKYAQQAIEMLGMPRRRREEKPVTEYLRNIAELRAKNLRSAS